MQYRTNTLFFNNPFPVAFVAYCEMHYIKEKEMTFWQEALLSSFIFIRAGHSTHTQLLLLFRYPSTSFKGDSTPCFDYRSTERKREKGALSM